MKKAVLLVFGTILFIRFLFINFNFAEWGDSYRFLKAGKALTQLSYPLDEKRQPLYPLLISPGNFIGDPILYARVVNFFLFALALVLVYLIAKKLLKSEFYSLSAVILTAFNPAFFYWSLRIMAENLLVVIALLAFYIFFTLKENTTKSTVLKYSLLGLLCGLAYLTRFDGVLLLIPFVLSFFIAKKELLRKQFPAIFSFFIVSFITVLPWLFRNYVVFKSPIKSSYFAETNEFGYNLHTFLYWATSVLFLFSTPSIWLLVFRGFNPLTLLRTSPYKIMLLYVVLVVVLNFIWPAAIPRLLVPVVPFLSILFMYGLTIKTVFFNKKILVLGFGLIILFVILRLGYVRYPFLIYGKLTLLLVVLLNLISLFWQSLNIRVSRFAFFVLVTLCQIIVLFTVLQLHRNVGKTVTLASFYLNAQNKNVAFSDETGVSSYYLNNAFRYNDYLGIDGQYKFLKDNKVEYVLKTNEHNEGPELNVMKEGPYQNNFLEITRFESKIGDTSIWSKIYKVN